MGRRDIEPLSEIVIAENEPKGVGWYEREKEGRRG